VVSEEPADPVQRAVVVERLIFEWHHEIAVAGAGIGAARTGRRGRRNI